MKESNQMSGMSVFKSDNNLNITNRVEDGLTDIFLGTTRPYLLAAEKKAKEKGTYVFDAYAIKKDGSRINVLCTPN